MPFDGPTKKSCALCKADGCFKYRQGDCDGFCITHFKNSPELEPETKPSPSKKRKRDLCKVNGCPKARIGRCNGMCQAHFNATSKLAETPAPPSPPKVMKIGKRKGMCKVAGCPRTRQGKCNGFCHTHFKEFGSPAAPAATISPAKKRTGSSGKKNVSSPTKEKAKKRKHDFCNVEGCSKYRQNRCDGMCSSHYTEFSYPRAESMKAGALPEELDFAEELGFPAGWSARENKNSNYLIYGPKKERRFTSKREAYAFAGLKVPPLDRTPKQQTEEEEEEDPPWRLSGHKFIGRKVEIPSDDGSSLVGTIVGWIADTDVDKDGEPGFVSEETGQPACLFSVYYGDGTSQDFEEHELENNFVSERTTKASKAAAAGASRMPSASKRKRRAKGDWCKAEGCPKARTGLCKGFCRAHFIEFTRKSSDGGGSSQPTASASGAAAVAAPAVAAVSPPSSSTSAKGGDGGGGRAVDAATSESSQDRDKKRPAELEGVAEDDLVAIMAALEPPRKATRSGREFTSPLVGQL